ncbi:MAG: YlbE-like family protein [Bacilli bacterium]|jgi:hypothetical protein
MNLDVQFKINSDPNLKRYLRENSYWYKSLNRNPFYLNEFINEMKEKYQLRTSDKISNIVETIEMINLALTFLK